MSAPLNPRYRGRNLAAYNFAGFAAIALVVFLLATQPFFLTDVLRLPSERVGAAIGILGVVDELTVVVCGPLLGALTDKINAWAASTTCVPSGTRVIELASFVVLGAAFAGYGAAHSVFPDLLWWRAVFAVGATGTMGTMTVMLHEANNSDFDWSRVVWRADSRPLLADPEADSDPPTAGDAAAEGAFGTNDGRRLRRKNGRLAALLGVSTGVGAVFSVSFFLTLPVRLSNHLPNLTRAASLRLAYQILGGVACGAGAVVYVFAYDCVRQRKLANAAAAPIVGYGALLRQGFEASRHSRDVQLAHVGGFVARSTGVATAVFIPVMVYKFYSAIGACGDAPDVSPPLKADCYDGYIFLAILTGVAQTVALVSSPAWGLVADMRRWGSRTTLVGALVCGMAGCFGLCFSGSAVDVYDPRCASCFVLVSLIGLSQIGTVISSMSLLSEVGTHDLSKGHQVIGSISGIYSLCGGVGILLIMAIGGWWSDSWVFGPFLLLGSFNVVLIGVATRR